MRGSIQAEVEEGSPPIEEDAESPLIEEDAEGPPPEDKPSSAAKKKSRQRGSIGSPTSNGEGTIMKETSSSGRKTRKAAPERSFVAGSSIPEAAATPPPDVTSPPRSPRRTASTDATSSPPDNSSREPASPADTAKSIVQAMKKPPPKPSNFYSFEMSEERTLHLEATSHQEVHYKLYLRYKDKAFYCSFLPTALLAALQTVVTNYPRVAYKVIEIKEDKRTLLITVMGLIMGLLPAIAGYWKWDALAEKHLNAAKAWRSLRAEVLSNCNNPEWAKEFHIKKEGILADCPFVSITVLTAMMQDLEKSHAHLLKDEVEEGRRQSRVG
jgi:hypothetical protein